MLIEMLRERLEAKEFGLYKLSEVVSITSLGNSTVICYTMVGAEAHHSHSVVHRVAVIDGEGRNSNGIIVN